MVSAENLQLQTIGKDRTELILPLRQICVGVPWTNIVWIHVHDNEETSRQVAIETLTQIQQGCLLDLHHNGQREISVNNSNLNYQFDPNRIFTSAGRQSALKCRQGDCQLALVQLSQAVNKVLNQYLSHTSLIVALHNNHPGGLSMRSYMTWGSMAHTVYQIANSSKYIAHDFFYVTTKQAFVFFASRGFNVVWQNNEFMHDDGSLSVWAAQQKIDYINVEARMGHDAEQTMMLTAVWDYMQKYYL